MKQAYQKFGKNLQYEHTLANGEKKTIKLEKPKSYASKPIKDIGSNINPFNKLEEI